MCSAAAVVMQHCQHVSQYFFLINFMGDSTRLVPRNHAKPNGN